MRRVVCLCVLLVATGATGSWAQTDTTTDSEINSEPTHLSDTIVVTANRSLTPIRAIGSTITVITADEIGASQVTSVSDLLRTVPGVDVVQTGGPGRTTSVFLRGSNSHHTLVLIDGVEMSDPSSSNGSFDFAHLNVDNIERVEVLRGAQSVLYGSDAIGGVIHIMTKRGSGQFGVEVKSEVGSYGSFNESLHVGGAAKSTDYSFTLSRKDTKGFSASRESLGSTEADGYENTEISGRIGLCLPSDLSLSLSGQASNAMADIDKSWGVRDDPNATAETDSRSLAVAISSRSSDSFWKPSFEVQLLNHEYESLDDPDPDHLLTGSRYASEGTRSKLATQHAFRLGEHSVQVGAETEREKYNSVSRSEGAYGPSGDTVGWVSSRTSSVYLLGQFSANENWYSTAGVRYDDHDQFGAHSTYRLTSAYLFDAAGVKIKGSLSTGVKSPSLFQLFHQTYGNPELEPEESSGWETGLEKTFSSMGLSFGATYYHAELKNLVALDPDTYRSINISEVSARGVELFGEYATPKTTFRADYTYSDTRNETDTIPIIRRPKNKFKVTLSHALTKHADLNLAVLHVGTRHDTDFRPYPAEQVKLDRYTVTNLSASCDLYDWLRLHGRVHNLFNDEYEEVLTYGTSRRAGYFGLTVIL